MQPTSEIKQGVYLDEHRSCLLVVGVEKGVAQTIRIDGALIVAEKKPTWRIAADYPLALPDYPLRKAACIFRDSTIPKDAQSERLLELIITQQTKAKK